MHAPAQITQLGYRCDFIAVHTYGADFDTATAVAELVGYLNATYTEYGKPLWLTEFGLTRYVDANGNFLSTPIYPTYAQQAAFINAVIPVLESLPYLEKFAWFALQDGSSDTKSLYGTNGSPTPTGAAYRAF